MAFNSFSLDVRGDLKEMRRHLNDTQKKALPRVNLRAINRAVRASNTETRREMSRRTGIQQKLMGKRIKFKLARNRNRPIGKVIILTAPMPVRRLGKPRQTPHGAKVKRAIFPGSFVAKMPGGLVGVWERKQKTRPVGPGARQRPKQRGALPIRQVTIPIDPPFRRVARKAISTVGRRAFIKEWRRLMKVAAKPKGAAALRVTG